MVGMLPGKGRKVVGIKAPSTSQGVKSYLNNAMGRFGAAKRSFLGKR